MVEGVMDWDEDGLGVDFVCSCAAESGGMDRAQRLEVVFGKRCHHCKF